jgi:hypothetical protein
VLQHRHFPLSPLFGYVILVSVIGCTDPTRPIERHLTAAQSLHEESATDAAVVPIYSVGALRRATPHSPCVIGPSRQFDFWIGQWQVSNAAGKLVAGSHIESDLDGCVVKERWLPLSGPRGRSLNSYDATTGEWRQTWVPQQGPGSRPLRLAGALGADGIMRMAGVRHHWYYGFPYFDAYSWTPLDATHVLQTTRADIPAFNVHIAGALTYERTASLLTSTSPGTSSCQAGGDAAETRLLDFVAGEWRIGHENGLELGRSSIVVDPTLGGCLIEETFSTSKGYRAIAWLYYDPIENKFFRTYIDSEGARLELIGAPAVGPLVMEGEQPVPGGPNTRVRLTWTRDSDTRLVQTWAISTDEGATWRETLRLDFVRQ